MINILSTNTKYPFNSPKTNNANPSQKYNPEYLCYFLNID